MAEHPNVVRIRDGYAAFAKGDFAALNNLFAEDLLWHDAGRNQTSGEYRGREAVYGFFGKLMEITEGSFRADLHAVLADDEQRKAGRGRASEMPPDGRQQPTVAVGSNQRT